MDGLPTTKYAKNGSTHLAYQVIGDGPIDLVLVEGWVHHVEAFWQIPELARQRRRTRVAARKSGPIPGLRYPADTLDASGGERGSEDAFST